MTDHSTIIATLNIKSFKPKPQIKPVRRLKAVLENEWIEEFNPDNVPLTDKLNTLVQSFTTELNCVLEKLAPEKKRKITGKLKQPWYDVKTKALKRKMHKSEHKWLKYKLESCWTAFKKA